MINKVVGEREEKKQYNFYINQVFTGLTRIFLSNKSNNSNFLRAFNPSGFHYYVRKDFISCFSLILKAPIKVIRIYLHHRFKNQHFLI